MTRLAVEEILGYSVARGGIVHCVDSIATWIARSEDTGWLACINPHSYATALQQPRFAAALHAADWLIPDGVGIVFASRFLGGEIRERVTGSDIFHGVMKKLDENAGHSVFFLGSTEETLIAIRARMARDFPTVEIAGTYSPAFRDTFTAGEIDAFVTMINKTKANVLWVGMTAPKQEVLISQALDNLETVKFAAAIGAVFDFYTGKVKRSHPIFQRLGLEWLPRLVQEPSRLWRRMFVSAPIFIWHVLSQKFAALQK